MISRESILALTLAALALGLAACDPAGPAASGEIALGKDVDASGFKTLKMRAVVDSGSPFVPLHPVFTGPASAGAEPFPSSNEDLAGLEFPHAYDLGGGIGTIPEERWRLFAWLSTQDQSTSAEDAPSSGEPYGTTTFSLSSCGAAGDFCGTTTGVNVTLDQKAP
jgi:hypothetical protein